MKQQHKIVMTVGSNLSGAIVAQLIDKLLNIGLADAQATVENGEGDTETAEEVLSLELSAPGEWEMPAAVLEVNCGAIHCVRASEPMRIVILDQDTEGCDEDSCVMEINNEEVCVLDYSLTKFTGICNDGLDPEFVMQTLEQLDNGEPRSVLSAANDEIPVGQAGRLVSIDDEEIIGTLERLPGTASIGSATRSEDGSIEIEFGGGTDVQWDDQKTVKVNGERLFVTASGETIPESMIKVVADD